MAGTLVIDTLNASSGVLATQNGMTGIAKAWVNFNGAPATPTLTSSFNVSSVTKNGTGDFTVNFTTSMSTSTYSYQLSCGNSTSWGAGSTIVTFRNTTYALSTGSIRCGFKGSDFASTSPTDPSEGCVAVFQ